jgi:two-component system heavy metal sensor histidine kinase CusS
MVPSLAWRMTIWYALSTFALIFVASGLLYWGLASSLYHEDLRDLADNLINARLLLPLPATRTSRPAAEAWPSWAPRHQPEIYLRVLDVDGRTLVATPGMARELPPPPRRQLTSLPASGERIEAASPGGKPFLTLIMPVTGRNGAGSGQVMQVAMDRGHDEYLLARYRERLWFALGVSLVLCSLAGYLIARGGMKPIENIGRTAARIRSTTLNQRIAVQGLPAELAELAVIFNSMLDRIEEAFRHISQFSDDAAHELRTPINNLRGEIEVALGQDRSADEYREVLASCGEECARISRLIQTLLLLARSEASGDVLRRETVDVGQVLADMEAFYGAAAAEAGICLHVSSDPRLHADLDRTLFQQSIGNLVSNAIAHTPAGGSVNLAARATGMSLMVTVSDTGCGIAPEHLPHVFERFYRVDRARAGSAYNAGLGLAVVKSIVTRHGGHVEIASAVGRGTEVRLILPMSA